MALVGSKTEDTALDICEMCGSKSKSPSMGSQSTANLDEKLMETAKQGHVECVEGLLGCGRWCQHFR